MRIISETCIKLKPHEKHEAWVVFQKNLSDPNISSCSDISGVWICESKLSTNCWIQINDTLNIHATGASICLLPSYGQYFGYFIKYYKFNILNCLKISKIIEELVLYSIWNNQKQDLCSKHPSINNLKSTD